MKKYLQESKAKKAKKPQGVDPHAWPAERDAEMREFYALPLKDDAQKPKADQDLAEKLPKNPKAKNT